MEVMGCWEKAENCGRGYPAAPACLQITESQSLNSRLVVQAAIQHRGEHWKHVTALFLPFFIQNLTVVVVLCLFCFVFLNSFLF